MSWIFMFLAQLQSKQEEPTQDKKTRVHLALQKDALGVGHQSTHLGKGINQTLLGLCLNGNKFPQHQKGPLDRQK